MKIWPDNLFISGRKILIVILFVSVSLRVLAAFYFGNTVEELPGTFDQISYHNLAIRVLNGYGFSFDQVWWPITPAGEPTAHWSFLYTLYLVFVYSVFGPNPLIARLLQAVIVGLLHPILVYQLGRKVFGVNVGIGAALITAIYVYFVYYSATLMTEPFYITAILGGLLLSMKFVSTNRKESHIYTGFLLGTVLGITVLFRQLYLLFIPFLLIWMGLVMYRKRRRVPIIGFGLIIVVIAIFILPFSFYNYMRFGKFVLLNTNSGYAFFWGNHPIYGTHFIPILTPEMGSYQDLIPLEVRYLDEAALDQELLKRGIQFILDDPGRYVLLSISRIPAYFIFWPSKESGIVSNVSRVASFGFFLPFMLIGLFRSFYKKLLKTRIFIQNFFETNEGILIIFILFYTIIHLLTWALVRYRLPVDAVLVVYASFGIAFLYEHILQVLGYSPKRVKN